MAIQSVTPPTNREAPNEFIVDLIKKIYDLEFDTIQSNAALEKEILEIEGHIKERQISHLEMRLALEQKIDQLSKKILHLEASIEKLQKETDLKRILKFPIDELMTTFYNVRDVLVPKHTHVSGRSKTTKTFNL